MKHRAARLLGILFIALSNSSFSGNAPSDPIPAEGSPDKVLTAAEELSQNVLTVKRRYQRLLPRVTKPSPGVREIAGSLYAEGTVWTLSYNEQYRFYNFGFKRLGGSVGQIGLKFQVSADDLARTMTMVLKFQDWNEACRKVYPKPNVVKTIGQFGSNTWIFEYQGAGKSGPIEGFIHCGTVEVHLDDAVHFLVLATEIQKISNEELVSLRRNQALTESLR
jgi:hypothetical protein